MREEGQPKLLWSLLTESRLLFRCAVARVLAVSDYAFGPQKYQLGHRTQRFSRASSVSKPIGNVLVQVWYCAPREPFVGHSGPSIMDNRLIPCNKV